MQSLRSSGLSKFYPRFKARGVTEENFVDLQLEDYEELGVVDQQDRHKLFRLKQIIKQEMNIGVKNQAAARRLGNGLSNLAAAINAPPAPAAAPQPQPSAAAQARERALAEAAAVAAYEPAFAVQRPQHQAQAVAAPPPQRGARIAAAEPTDIDLYGDDDFLAPVAPAPVFGGRRSGGNGRVGAAAAAAAAGIGMSALPSQQQMQQQQPAPSQVHRVASNAAMQYRAPAAAAAAAAVDDDDDEYNDDDDANDESFVDGGARRQSGGGGGGGDEKSDRPRKSKISVVVRKRPLNSKELKNAEVDILTVRDKLDSVVVHEPKVKVNLDKYTNNIEFTFDGVFDIEANNAAIYRRTAQPLIEHVFKKGKATCFAYGQVCVASCGNPCDLVFDFCFCFLLACAH